MKLEVKLELKLEVKLEVKVEVKLEVKAEVKLAVKPKNVYICLIKIAKKKIAMPCFTTTFLQLSPQVSHQVSPQVSPTVALLPNFFLYFVFHEKQ